MRTARRSPLLTIGAAALLAAGCASSGAVPRPFPTPGPPDSARAAPLPPVLADPASASSPVAATALSFQGVPYRNGGADPTGFDCSGLVAYVFAQHGLVIPRTAAEQFSLGDQIEANNLLAGDLVFFSTIAPGPSHVGIVVSGTQFVHAPSSNGVVRVEYLTAPYWASRYVGARRVR